MCMKKAKKEKKAFTLIELLAVVLIIGVLSSIAVPQYRRSLERSRVAEVLEMLPALHDSWQRYSVEMDQSMSNGVSIKLLDVTMKGKVSGNGWQTANFLYSTSYQNDEAFVVAKLRKGKYTGTVVAYNGESFNCVDSTEHPGGCKVFNLGAISGFYAD